MSDEQAREADQAAAEGDDESVEEFEESIESDPAYSPDDDELKRTKGG